MKQAQATIPARPSLAAIAALLAAFGAGLFAMGIDQGHIFSLVEGSAAFDSMYLHELSHDVRHAAGFPCH
ncbi:MAG: CbtB-domain containing protein [Thaumarchaeota archaeon]|nr:CbtB-domain containing protein [Nitrososphaerota archaeon]MDD9808740.1 CbtB-domain containing protein [Nitrososphaerota archaeon]MDD9814309.1 CbtB-domain containing protein [Nitrososphaerota archaeon]MDD9825396.1 CbtB-domain containing protein [Nitrososphaerota archaeon]RNJ74755.1 MAG: CbtB-domain containing protein [Thaumarchaeota archaeon S13]